MNTKSFETSQTLTTSARIKDFVSHTELALELMSLDRLGDWRWRVSCCQHVFNGSMFIAKTITVELLS